MTVTNPITTSGPYGANGVNKLWDYLFSCASKDHIKLTYTIAGIVTTVPTAQFTVSNTFPTDSGGVITFPLGIIPALPVGATVNIERVVPYTQPSSIKNQSRFYPQTHEEAFDNLARQIQQMNRRLAASEATISGLLATALPGFIAASQVTVVPNAELASTTVQTALEELQSEILLKEDLGHVHPQSEVDGLIAALATKLDNAILTSKGDLLSHSATTEARFGVGANGLFLKADSAEPLGMKWSGAGVVAYQEFLANGLWTKPLGLSSIAMVRIRLWGGGGSGGKGAGSGGGGGGFSERWILASLLGATEAVGVALGGLSVSALNSAGNVGGTSTFGIWASAFGGGPGSTLSATGGGGGGAISAGGTPGSGRPSLTGTLSAGNPSCGGDSATTTPPGGGIFNGGGGGSVTPGAANGGDSIYGGGGGGGGTAVTTGGVSVYGGNGGAGNGGAISGTAGSVPGGGGGGTGTGSGSGAGGAGKVEVLVFDGGA